MPLLFMMFDEQGNICHCIEVHISQLAQWHGEPMTVDGDDLSIYMDPRDKMIHLHDEFFDATTQYARLPSNAALKQCYNSSNPALNAML